MDNHEWAKLFNQFYPDKLEFDKNKHLFTKVAFDVFRLNSSPVESLWILEDGEDGKQYLSATYESDNDVKEASKEWNTLSNKEASIVVLYYKDFPIQKFAAKEYGFKADDVQIFQKTIINKINIDKDFVKKIIEAQPEDKKNIVLKQFPELVQK